jgi:HEAT repeats
MRWSKLSLLLVVFAWASAPSTACAQPSATVSLDTEMAARQSAEAPVILRVKVANTSTSDVTDFWRAASQFVAYLTPAGGQRRRVHVTNDHFLGVGVFRADVLKVGETVVVPLRLTNLSSENRRDYLPSEYVYLSAGDYLLELERPTRRDAKAPGPWARTSVKFRVVKDAALGQARWNELKNPAKGDERFAEHVLKATLTPEVRRQWYEAIRQPELTRQRCWQAYMLSSYYSAGYTGIPADIAPALAEALKVHVQNPATRDRDLNNLLNNLAYAMLNVHPDGMGPTLLKLALGDFDPSSRVPAIEALRYYYEDTMADQIAGLLESQDKWVPRYAARLLAWAGDERGVAVLVAAAKEKHARSAAGLAYLPSNSEAAQTLREALASDDTAFVTRLKARLLSQPTSRNGKKP